MYNKERILNPVSRRLGVDWSKHYQFSPEKMVTYVQQQLQQQLIQRQSGRQHVDVVRANLFTSTKNDTVSGGSRDNFFRLFQNNPAFDVHL
jgi:hypothetical protein